MVLHPSKKRKRINRSFFIYIVCSFIKNIMTPLVNVVVILIIVGVVLWLINRFIPMDSKIKQILNIVVVIAVIIWLLKAFGLLNSLNL